MSDQLLGDHGRPNVTSRLRIRIGSYRTGAGLISRQIRQADGDRREHDRRAEAEISVISTDT